MAVDMQSMIHADIMESCVHKSAQEKAAAHPITEPPPVYRDTKTIVLLKTCKTFTHLTDAQHIALHHFAVAEVPTYAKVPITASAVGSSSSRRLMITADFTYNNTDG